MSSEHKVGGKKQKGPIHVRAWWKARLTWWKARRMAGFDQGHWSRIVMDRETARFVREFGPSTRDALEISGEKWRNYGFKSYRCISYPDYDLCGGTLNEDFDIIIIEQVLEHVLWPYRAVRNLWQMLRPDGVLIVTTPFLLRVHNYPTDCSRWTEEGMRHLLAEGGFALDDIVTGSWGNRACVKANFSAWTNWNPYLHSLRNEPDFPIVVWAFATKR